MQFFEKNPLAGHRNAFKNPLSSGLICSTPSNMGSILLSDHFDHPEFIKLAQRLAI